MSYRNKRVLVTGADGFIGSHLAEALAAAGANVTALAFYNSFDTHGWLDDCHAEMRKVRGDVRDGAQMMRLCEGQDIVFHLAALIGIPHSYEAPRSYLDTNAGGALNIFEAARHNACGRVVVTSTSEESSALSQLPGSSKTTISPRLTSPAQYETFCTRILSSGKPLRASAVPASSAASSRARIGT